MIAERIDKADAELRVTTKAQIDADTAATWGARAVAAHRFYVRTGDIGRLIQAVDYAHECCEHAAGGPDGTLERIRAELSALTGGRL